MRTKIAEHIKIINTRIPEELDKFITNYCIENNKSKSEFVRDAVEHYINYLNHEANLKEVKEKLTEHKKTELSEFDKEFNNNFFYE